MKNINVSISKSEALSFIQFLKSDKRQIEFEIYEEENEIGFFSIDLEMLNIVIPAIGGLLASILAYFSGKNSRKIKIKSKDGIEIEFPSNISKKKLNYIISIIDELDSKITIRNE